MTVDMGKLSVLGDISPAHPLGPQLQSFIAPENAPGASETCSPCLRRADPGTNALPDNSPFHLGEGGEQVYEELRQWGCPLPCRLIPWGLGTESPGYQFLDGADAMATLRPSDRASRPTRPRTSGAGDREELVEQRVAGNNPVSTYSANTCRPCLATYWRNSCSCIAQLWPEVLTRA
jgi:hypothetical protein